MLWKKMHAKRLARLARRKRQRASCSDQILTYCLVKGINTNVRGESKTGFQCQTVKE